MKTKSILVMVILITLTSMFYVSSVKANNGAQEGTLSLFHFPDSESFSLDGEWEFYWGELYDPKELENDKHEPTYVNIPNTWTNYQINNKALPNNGFATYRLIVQVPSAEIGSVKAIYIPSVASSYRLWINGVEKSSSGIVGKNKETMEPDNIPKIITFKVDSTDIEFVIQAANFSQRKSGIHESILMGESESILQYHDKKILYRSIIVMSLVTMGFYHLVLFYFRRNAYSLLFFGVTCLLIAIRAILLEEELSSYIFSFLNWEIRVKFEYWGASLGLLFFSLFTYTQFSKDMSRMIINFIVFGFSLYSVFVLFTPAVIYTKTMVPFQIMIMMVIIYLLIVYSLAFVRRRAGALLNMFAILMLFITTVNDFLFFNFIVTTTELASVGLVFFLFTQSITISKKFATAFRSTEELSEKLTELNESLEQTVNCRTLELQEANEDLQKTNEELCYAYQSRSDWIQNTSHEFATPLTSIRSYSKGMLDGVIPKDDKYIQIINDQTAYLSRLLVDLNDMSDIELKQIHFNLKEVPIGNYLSRLYQEHKLDLEKSGKVLLLQNNIPLLEKDPIVVMDELRIQQVLVNLVTNALRFIKADGEIVVTLKRENSGHVLITVQDNGYGIEADELPLIFQRFYKGKQQQGDSHNGSGLGLAITKEIIEYHKGKIWAESKVGVGSCFYIQLPIVKES